MQPSGSSLSSSGTRRARRRRRRPPAPPPPLPAGAISWPDSDALGVVDFLVDGVVGANGPFGLNGLMDLLTDGTAAASVDLATLLPAPLVLPIPGLFNATVALRSLPVSGLDALTTLELAEPVRSDAAALRFAAALGALNLSVDATVGFARASGYKTKALPLKLGVTLMALDLNATARLALNRSGLGALALSQWLAPSCVARQALPLGPPSKGALAAVAALGGGATLASLGGPDRGRGEAKAALSLAPSPPRARRAAVLGSALAAAPTGVLNFRSPPPPPRRARRRRRRRPRRCRRRCCARAGLAVERGGRPR